MMCEDIKIENHDCFVGSFANWDYLIVHSFSRTTFNWTFTATAVKSIP